MQRYAEKKDEWKTWEEHHMKMKAETEVMPRQGKPEKGGQSILLTTSPTLQSWTSRIFIYCLQNCKQ